MHKIVYECGEVAGSDVGSTSSDRAGAGNMVSADATASVSIGLCCGHNRRWLQPIFLWIVFFMEI